jgi:hypothetical protein
MSEWIWSGILILGALTLMSVVMWVTEEGFELLQKKFSGLNKPF